MREARDNSFNLAESLLSPHRTVARADRVAYINSDQSWTFGELDRLASQYANLMQALGLQRENRVLLCLHDSIEWVAAFLGCVKAGIVPVATNTMLTTSDYDYLLQDSRAKALIVDSDIFPRFAPVLKQQPDLTVVLTAGPVDGQMELAPAVAAHSETFTPAATRAEEPAFWQYSSGTTGCPKGVVHLHGSLTHCVENYAKGVLGISDDDIIFSAARMFFGYGMGNSIAFPLGCSAAAVLTSARPTPQSVCAELIRHQPTVFFGVPTLYAAMLASGDLPSPDKLALRLCVSAGEALPAKVGREWRERTGLDIVEGLGSTEMLHIFVSQRPGQVRYGTAGTPVPGYDIRIVDETGCAVPTRSSGELHVRGPSSAAHYWCQVAKTHETFLGPWVRSADRCLLDDDGFLQVIGRSDDMLKVGGIYVSPLEVEAAILEHGAVAEVAVVGSKDIETLVKPKAFVVLKPEFTPSEDLATEIKNHVKQLLAPFKYPRWIEFVDALPKTPTGKLKRFELR